MCVATSVCALPSSQQNSQRAHGSPTGTPTPPSTLDFRTSEGGGRGLFRLYLRRYGSVGAETACASLRVCAPCTHHSSSASGALTRPPARPHHPPRSISGPQNGSERVCFGCISAAMAPLELKLRVRRYECVRRALITAEQPARPCLARRHAHTALHARFQDLRRGGEGCVSAVSPPLLLRWS